MIAIDALTFDEAIDAIEGLVVAGKGGMVFTPNVDHIMLAEEDSLLRAAYERADLSLVDGTPVMWAAHLLGSPLPEKISGSDLIRPLAARAAARGWRVYLLGGRPGVATQAKEILEREYPGLKVVGTSSPMIDLSRDVSEQQDVVDAIRRARPDLLFLALGAPKQEILGSPHPRRRRRRSHAGYRRVARFRDGRSEEVTPLDVRGRARVALSTRAGAGPPLEALPPAGPEVSGPSGPGGAVAARVTGHCRA